MSSLSVFLSIVPQQNQDRCHCFWPTYSIDVWKYPVPHHLFSREFISPFPFSFPLLYRQQKRQAKSGDIYAHFLRPLITAPFLKVILLVNLGQRSKHKFSKGFSITILEMDAIGGSCLQCPSKRGINVTAIGQPILWTSENTLYPISFIKCLFPPSLSHSLYYDVNRICRPKAVTFIPTKPNLYHF